MTAQRADPTGPDGTPLDIVDCADEPIRIPGSVQPHGALLAATLPDLTVVMVSRNLTDHLGMRPEDALDQPLSAVAGSAVVQAATSDDPGDPRPVDVVDWHGQRRRFDCIAHRSQGLLVVELEPRAEQSGTGTRLRSVLRALQSAGTQEQLVGVLAAAVRDVTGFDRVMVYRFDEEWNGEVVAEERRPDLEPFLGLHYPASDIPAQARDLYTMQWLRSIPDARYTPSPLVPASVPGTGEPLDLSGATLRSVSPVHLQYLANMGVRASMSVSLVVHGRLWGLVACHHYAGAHYPSAAARSTAEFLGRTASLLLQGKEDEARHVDDLAVAAASSELTRTLALSGRDPLAALVADDRVLDLMDGPEGAAVRIGGELRLVGRTPERGEVEELLELLWSERSAVVATSSLGADHPDSDLPPRIASCASGVLLVPLTASSRRDALVWFRPEVLRDVRWAGNPDAHGVEATPQGLQLTPRASFAAWVQQVRGRSLPWRPAEIAAGRALADDVDEHLARQKSEDERLTAALQRVVLTERPPLPEGYTMAQRYRPSGSDALGGDWYDVTQLPDGRTVFMVGDVAGHGMGLAAITAQVRHALRAYLVNEGSAVAALRRIHELVTALLPGALATVVAAELVPTTGRVTLSRAGHLPPLLLQGGQATHVSDIRGPALGVHLPDATLTEVTVDLAPGDTLLLYSDGLVEERGTHLRTSLSALRTRAGELVDADLEQLCDALLGAAAGTDDDITLVAIRRT